MIEIKIHRKVFTVRINAVSLQKEQLLKVCIMLTKFVVENYRGFMGRLEWDLSKPGSYTYNTNAISNGIIKNGVIYGRNGAGKSNLGLALFDIANHLSHKWTKPDYYLNYACAAHYDQPVKFEYTFSLGGHTLVYCYSKVVDSEMKVVILQELLYIDNKEVFQKDEHDLKVAIDFGLSEEAIQNFMESANNISVVKFLLGTVPLPEGHALLRLRYFVENMLFFRSLDYREFIGLNEGRSNIEEYILNNALADDFADFLNELSGVEYKFAPVSPGDKMLYCLFDGNKVPFQMVASTGTLNLELQYFWLKEMVKASFVFVDEFDAFYHFDLSYHIAERLFEGENQVFLTTHDTFLLSNDLLRPDCFFVLKSNEIKDLCDLTDKELRSGHNLEKLYRGGKFDL